MSEQAPVETVTPPVVETPPATPPVETPPAEVPSPEVPSPEAPPAEPVYELKLSENSPLKEEDIGSVVEFAKANKMSPEQAQATLVRNEALLTGFREAQQRHLDSVHAQWLKDVESDPEIGGAKLKETSADAELAFKHFGNEKLGEVLERSKLGNHPEFVRFAAKIGALIKNDRSVHSNTTVVERSREDILYGSMK